MSDGVLETGVDRLRWVHHELHALNDTMKKILVQLENLNGK